MIVPFFYLSSGAFEQFRGRNGFHGHWKPLGLILNKDYLNVR